MPEPFVQNDLTTLYQGDLRDVLPGLPAEGIDAVVKDPPYGLGFLEKDWDHEVPRPEYWRVIARVCKPGAWLLAFGGTRTYHRLACAIEDAGWEIRDGLVWLYGMPKCGDIGKLIDKAKGAKREVVGTKLGRPGYSLADHGRTNEVYPVAETTVRGVQTAVVTGTLARWREAVKAGSSPKVAATVRHGFTRIYDQFCIQGLDVWGEFNIRPAADQTFYLEDKRGR